LSLNEEKLYLFWDELYDIGTASVDLALKHCKQTICDWIGAQNAYWIGAVHAAGEQCTQKDVLGGWRFGSIEVLNPSYTDAARLRQGLGMGDAREPGETLKVVMAAAGTFRVYSLGTGMIDIDRFRQTEYYDYFYRQPGIVDRLWVAFPVDNHVESVFLFDRHDGQERFSQSELQLAAAALRGLKWLHRNLSLSHGLGPEYESLIPSERRMLPHLLSGASEKTISERLNLSPSTVHQYASGIYRKFGARGRANFMALWLQGCG